MPLKTTKLCGDRGFRGEPWIRIYEHGFSLYFNEKGLSSFPGYSTILVEYFHLPFTIPVIYVPLYGLLLLILFYALCAKLIPFIYSIG